MGKAPKEKAVSPRDTADQNEVGASVDALPQTITRLRTVKGEPAGKTIDHDGEKFIKRKAKPVLLYKAKHHAINKTSDLVKVLNNATASDIMILGRWTADCIETGEPFSVISNDMLQILLREHDTVDCGDGVHRIANELTTSRLATNMRGSNFLMLDLDVHPDMPANLVARTIGDVRALISRFSPSLGLVDIVIAPSASGRVIDQDGNPVLGNASGWHAYVLLDDSVDIKLLPAAMKAHAFKCGMSWQKPIFDRSTGEVLRKNLEPFYDPAVLFQSNRIDYICPPTITERAVNAGAILSECNAQFLEGDHRTWDAADIDLDPASFREILQKEDINLDRNSDGWYIMRQSDLKLDTLLDLGDGRSALSVKDWFFKNGQHLRCQATPFRGSESMNAFISAHENGLPFVFDNGARIKHTLDDESVYELAVHVVDESAASGQYLTNKAARQLFGWLLWVDDSYVATDQLIDHIMSTKAMGGVLKSSLRKMATRTAEKHSNDGGTTHPEIADAVIASYGRDNMIFHSGAFYIWDTPRSGVWCRIDDIVIRKSVISHCRVVLNDKFTNQVITSIVELIKADRHNPTVRFNQHKDAINCQNGELIYNHVSSSWVLEPHCREHLFTTQIPVIYDPSALAPRFNQFLDEVFEGDGDIIQKRQVLLEMMGYSLLTNCEYEKFLMMIGSGANGKSVLLKVVEGLVGRNCACSVQPARLENPFQRAHLRGKLANIVTEIPQGSMVADAPLKAIVSGDLMTAEEKHRDPFDFHPFATCWFGTNHLPGTRDFSWGLFRRAIILVFNRKFVGTEQDTNLSQKLEAELTGILTMALSAIADVFTRGHIGDCPSSKEAKKEWRLEADQVAQFVESRCTTSVNGREEIGNLYEAYMYWADSEGIKRTLGKKSFGARLIQLGYTEFRKNTARYRCGLQLTNSQEQRDLEKGPTFDIFPKS